MKKLLTFVVILSSFLTAKELPIVKQMTLNIPKGNFSVFKFPFEIKGVQATSYLVKEKNKTLDALSGVGGPDSLSSLKKRVNQKKSKPKVSNSAKSIKIEKGVNTITFFPKKNGELELIVWGYSHPILLKIVVDEDYGDKVVEFLDYNQKKVTAEKLEMNSHSKVIVALIRSMYNGKVPSGYDSISSAYQFKDESTQLNLILNNSFVGKRYRVDEWMIKNQSNSQIRLHEEMFVKEGIYAVSFVNDLLPVGSTSRMFIVRATDN